MLVGATYRANSVHEIMCLQISVHTTAHIAVGVFIGAGCASLTSCRAALRSMSERDFFVAAVFAESEVRISAVAITERLKFVLMPRRCKVFFAANIALCAAQTSLSSAAVHFFFDVAACVLFKFAASALEHMTGCIVIARNGREIVLCVGIAKVAARCA